MADAPAPARLTSPANLLGLVRIGLTPVVIVLLVLPFPGAGIIAFVVFCVAAVTDFADGRVARARGEVSPFGVFMDLTADKVLVAGVLIAMVQVSLVPAWMVAIILIREFVVQGVRQLAATGSVVISARALGKSKTLTTLAAMAILLLAFDAAQGGPLSGLGIGDTLQTVGFWLMVVATALTLVSGYDYVAGAWDMLVGRRRD
jgi:CDP-diacylglycerol---glycerol-3-phosphate 3-phosphatidyltransferase